MDVLPVVACFLMFLCCAAVFMEIYREIHTLRTRLDDLQSSNRQAETEFIHNVCALNDQLDRLRARLDGIENKLSESNSHQYAATLQLRGMNVTLNELENRLTAPESIPRNHAEGLPFDFERDSQLSKAMEEGVMNLLQYAAGKTSGGVEGGLG